MNGLSLVALLENVLENKEKKIVSPLPHSYYTTLIDNDNDIYRQAKRMAPLAGPSPK